MKISILGYAIGEITLAAISYIDLVNEYMRVLAAIAATITLVFACVKFIRDERERTRRKKLLDLQIENEVRANEKYNK